MPEDVPFIVAVEGRLDEVVARKLLRDASASCTSVQGFKGKAWIDANASKLVTAGRGHPVLVIRDLDQDGCVVDLRRKLDDGTGRFARVRIAVRAIEAWILADRDAIAAALGVGLARIPDEPDALADPKRALVAVAQASKSAQVRRAVLPRERSGSSTGSGYNDFLTSVVREDWSPERAQARSPSLQRARRAIAEAAADYRAFAGIG